MWESEDWLANARDLVQWVNELESGPVLLLIRHSQRLEPDELDRILKEPLTPLGIEMAKEFGRRLRCDRIISIWHSHHTRTRETAEAIARGFGDLGNSAQIERPSRTLLGPGWDAPKYVGVAHQMGMVNFFDSWAKDRIPIDIIEPIGDFTQRLVKATIGRLMKAPKDSLHIHITHDLVVMAARKVFLDVDTRDDNPVAYLGGFGLTPSRGGLIGFLDYNQDFIRIGPS
ncbi:MAG: histidine phosphatase family protein [Promethearchaeota archaeon]